MLQKVSQNFGVCVRESGQVILCDVERQESLVVVRSAKSYGQGQCLASIWSWPNILFRISRRLYSSGERFCLDVPCRTDKLSCKNAGVAGEDVMVEEIIDNRHLFAEMAPE